MKRREFLKTTAGASIAATSALVFGNLRTMFANQITSPDNCQPNYIT